MTRAYQSCVPRLVSAARRRGGRLGLIGLLVVLTGIGATDAAAAEPVVGDLRITVNNDRRSTAGAFFVDIHSAYTIHVVWPIHPPRQDGHLTVSLRPAEGGSGVTLWDRPLDLTGPPADGAWTGHRLPMTPAGEETSAFFGSGRDWIVRADLSAAGVAPVSAETTVRLMQGPTDAGRAEVRIWDDTGDGPGHRAQGQPLPADGAVPVTARTLGYAWVPAIESLPAGSSVRFRVTDDAGRVIEESAAGLPDRLHPGRPLILGERPIRNHPGGTGQMPAGGLTLTAEVQTREGTVIDADTARFHLVPPEARDPFGNAVEIAACEGDAARLRGCLDSGCPLGPNQGSAAVMCAAEKGHTEIMAMLLNRGATPHARSKDGRYSALFAAAQQGHAATARTLIRHGADPNRRDYRGGTALHAAIWGGNLSLAQSLLAEGASPAPRDDKGRTAGYYAYWLHTDEALAARLGYRRPRDQASAPPSAEPAPAVSTKSEPESVVDADEIVSLGRSPSAHETVEDPSAPAVITIDEDDRVSPLGEDPGFAAPARTGDGGGGGGGAVSAARQGAHDETKRFAKPTMGGHGVDWCLNWHTNCGKVTADFYCETQGYDRSIAFEKWEDVPPTYILGDEEVCRLSYCDSFRFIECARGSVTRASAEARRFFKPRIGRYSLHWCYQETQVFKTEGLRCGETPADAFCRQNGYARAVKWEKWPDAGSSYFMGSGVLCKAPHRCPAFRNIWCER